MCDPWVINHLTKSIIQLLKESGFGYIKIDYNDSIGIGCDGAESLGEGLRQRIQATQSFFNQIKKEIPDIIVENCSSGGHRLEPSFLELTSQSSFSDAHEINSIPIIAANLHRVMKPSQSQIWAVIRESDSNNRLYYSIVNTFLGRMCLSGDVLNLTEEQWDIIQEGIQFYHQISDIIKYGKTILYENEIVSYNKPTGEQLVVRELDDKLLIIAHRFEDSKDMDLDFMKSYNILAEYGKIDSDFTAKAWLVKKK
jgi:alpha-galactosidase